MLLARFIECDVQISASRLLAIQLLPEINAHMTHPLQLKLKRPLQKSYPHINGLYLLLRASGMTHVVGTQKKPLLAIDREIYRLWGNLNCTEQYCFLLETWLLRGFPEIIGEREGVS
jgi:hypothetical protein